MDIVHSFIYSLLACFIPLCICRGVACKSFGEYGTRTCVADVVEFGEVPDFEANVRCLNPSATGPHEK